MKPNKYFLKLTFIPNMALKHYKIKLHQFLKKTTDSERHRVSFLVLRWLILYITAHHTLSETKGMSKCCLIDGETKVKEVKDSLYLAESLSPEGSTTTQSPWSAPEDSSISRLWIMWAATKNHSWTSQKWVLTTMLPQVTL